MLNTYYFLKMLAVFSTISEINISKTKTRATYSLNGKTCVPLVAPGTPIQGPVRGGGNHQGGGGGAGGQPPSRQGPEAP